MDDAVLRAMARWPAVPECRGWLGLDARGDWYLRDADAQARGAFPASKGSRITNDNLLEFITRNYAADARGCWYFQNGPQRVYVELEAAPFVWRIGADGGVVGHDGVGASAQEAIVDERGRVYLVTDRGIGLVHSLDMVAVGDAIEAGRWPLVELTADALPGRFGFVRSPAMSGAPRG